MGGGRFAGPNGINIHNGAGDRQIERRGKVINVGYELIWMPRWN